MALRVHERNLICHSQCILTLGCLRVHEESGRTLSWNLPLDAGIAWRQMHTRSTMLPRRHRAKTRPL